MAQSFNDDELQDIMSEIESLESGEDTSKDEPKAEVSSIQGHTDEEDYEDADYSPSQEQVVEPSESKTMMNFSVEGNTTLDLSFLAGGKMIRCVVKQDVFEVELEGGMKFTLPLLEELKKSA